MSKKTKKASSQDRLINDCIKVAAFTAAFDAAFRPDPDGDSKHATPIADSLFHKRDKPLRNIIHTSAMTLEAIHAKAQVARILFEDWTAAGLTREEYELDLLGSLAADVIKYIKRQKDAERAEELAQKREQANVLPIKQPAAA